MAEVALTTEEAYWLRELASMAAPLTCPGAEVRVYQALAKRGLAQFTRHAGWGLGWTATPAGLDLARAARRSGQVPSSTKPT